MSKSSSHFETIHRLESNDRGHSRSFPAVFNAAFTIEKDTLTKGLEILHTSVGEAYGYACGDTYRLSS